MRPGGDQAAGWVISISRASAAIKMIDVFPAAVYIISVRIFFHFHGWERVCCPI